MGRQHHCCNIYYYLTATDLVEERSSPLVYLEMLICICLTSEKVSMSAIKTLKKTFSKQPLCEN